MVQLEAITSNKNSADVLLGVTHIKTEDSKNKSHQTQ